MICGTHSLTRSDPGSPQSSLENPGPTKALQAPELDVLVSVSARSLLETSLSTHMQVSSLVNRGSALSFHVLTNTRVSFVPSLDPMVPPLLEEEAVPKHGGHF